MSTPHDPWSSGPATPDGHSGRGPEPEPEPEPQDRTVTHPSDGTFVRPAWPSGAGAASAAGEDPDATQIRPPHQPDHTRPDSGRQGYPQPDYARSDSGQQGYPQPNPNYTQPNYPQPNYNQPSRDYRTAGQPDFGPSGGAPQAYDPSGYGRPGDAQGYSAPPPSYPPPGYGSAGAPGYGPTPGGYYATPAATKSARKRPLIVGLVAVLVLALATVGFLVLRPSSSPAFTFAGKKIANADAVLTSAQAATAKLVTTRHGASDSDTRCYFARATSPARTTKKSDIDANVYCGPVLFVDGNASRTYLSFPLTRNGTKGGAVVLAAAATPTSSDPQAAPAGMSLARPDGATARSTSTLAVPTPPAAAANVFSTTADVTGQTLRTAPSDAVIGSRNGGVQITRLGTIARYGHGDDARSAPTGQKLIAFRTSAGPDEDGDNRFPFGSITVVVNGRSHAVPKSAATVVVAVPTSAAAADLVVDDAGVTQKISLLTGRPAATNIAVGRRRHHDGPSAGSKGITFTVSAGSDHVTRTARASLRGSNLRYWVRIGDNRHAASTGSALLYLDLTYSYTEPLKKPFTGPSSNGPYGFAPRLLTLHLPGGKVVAAHDYSTDKDRLFLLFAVPPTFTSGRLVISGSEGANKNGVTLAVKGAPYFDVHIPAG